MGLHFCRFRLSLVLREKIINQENTFTAHTNPPNTLHILIPNPENTLHEMRKIIVRNPGLRQPLPQTSNLHDSSKVAIMRATREQRRNTLIWWNDVFDARIGRQTIGLQHSLNWKDLKGNKHTMVHRCYNDKRTRYAFGANGSKLQTCFAMPRSRDLAYLTT